MDDPGDLAPVLTEAQERAVAQAQRAETARRRGRQTVRDLVLSMVVVAAVAVLVAQPWRQDSVVTPTPTVDWRPVAVAFAGTVDWPVLAPVGLSSGWQATSARIEPQVDGRTSLHVGWITSAQQYAGLEQSDTADVRYVDTVTLGGAPAGAPYLADGRSWARLLSADGATRSLVAHATRTDAVVTYVVTGSAAWDELEGLVSRLQVVPTPTPSAS